MKKKGGWHHLWARVVTRTQKQKVVGQDWHQNHQKLSQLKKKKEQFNFQFFHFFSRKF
jgi:hypothetical protein